MGPVVAKTVQKVASAQARHHQVENDDVELAFHQPGESVGAVRGRFDFEPGALHDRFDQVARRGVVFTDQSEHFWSLSEIPVFRTVPSRAAFRPSWRANGTEDSVMAERRKQKRAGATERRNPLRTNARLRPAGPALERRKLPRAKRDRLTVKLPAEVIQRLRAAVFHSPGLTVASFVEACIAERIDHMEAERGKVFSEKGVKLRPGRPRTVRH